MKYASILLIVVLGLVLCAWQIWGRPPLSPAKKIGFATVAFVEKKYGFQLCAEGGREKQKIYYLSYTFTCYNSHPMTVDEAREVIVPVIGDFLSAFNAHPEIADEFIQFPLTVENVRVLIIFNGTRIDEEVYDPLVEAVTSIDDKIYYRREVYIPPQPGVYGRKHNDYVETYAEAKAILEGARGSLRPSIAPQLTSESNVQ